jgi:hypothetical protein
MIRSTWIACCFAVACGDSGSDRSRVTLQIVQGGLPTSLPFVAGQDGDGPWQDLTSVDGKYSLEVTTERFGFAFRCPPTDDATFDAVQIEVVHATTSELTELTRSCLGPRDTVDVMLAVVGVPSTESWMASIGRQFKQESGSGSFAWQVAPSKYDVAWATPHLAPVERLIVQRDVAVTPDLTLTFDAAASVATQRALLAIENVAGSQPSAASWLYTRSGSQVYLGSATAGMYVHAPTSLYETGDTHLVSAFATTPTTSRSATAAFATPIDLTLTLPPLLAVTPSLIDGTYRRLRVELPPAAACLIDWALRDGQRPRAFSVPVSEGWLGERAEMAVPDLSTTTGWDPAWAPPPGATTYSIIAYDSNRPFVERTAEIAAPVYVVPSDGARETASAVYGSLPP